MKGSTRTSSQFLALGRVNIVALGEIAGGANCRSESSASVSMEHWQCVPVSNTGDGSNKMENEKSSLDLAFRSLWQALINRIYVLMPVKAS